MNNEYCGLGTVRWLVILGAVGLISCGGTKGVVNLRQYHLRSVSADTGGIESIRAEKLKRLHGAVSAEERRNRLGHYYIIRWKGPKGREADPVRILFQYRQAATGSAIRRMETTLPGTRKGVTEFQVTGPTYLEGGRVLAWHLGFYRGEELVETLQSYLWD